MVFEQLLTGSRWEILQELARTPKSTSQLAKALSTSQANVSQQLKQLELAGLVTRKRSKSQRVHYKYEITKDILQYFYVSQQGVTKKTFTDKPLEMFIAALTIHDHSVPLLTFILSRPELTSRFTAIGVLKRPRPELFVIADSVEDIRREHANINVHTLLGEQKIILWSHTVQEVEDGIKRQDPYFLEALKNITLSFDPEQSLLKLKTAVQEQSNE